MGLKKKMISLNREFCEYCRGPGSTHEECIKSVQIFEPPKTLLNNIKYAEIKTIHNSIPYGTTVQVYENEDRDHYFESYILIEQIKRIQTIKFENTTMRKKEFTSIFLLEDMENKYGGLLRNKNNAFDFMVKTEQILEF